jgi:hypothetical protein
MKKIVTAALLALFLAAPAAFAADGFPMTLAGFTLGQDVKQYVTECDPGIAAPMPDAPFLTEMHLKADCVGGVRGGSLTYANCKDKDKLVRIKIKFHDRGKGLFEKLLVKYQEAFGKPDSYQGDTFRNVIAWQWDFRRGDEKVSVLLMWSRENEVRPGVSIKMTLQSLLDSEYACYRKKFDKRESKRGGPSRIGNLDEFLPR